jgi:hypothetical protein
MRMTLIFAAVFTVVVAAGCDNAAENDAATESTAPPASETTAPGATDNSGEAAQDALGRAGESALDTLENLGEAGREGIEALQENAPEIRENLREAGERIQRAGEALIEDNDTAPVDAQGDSSADIDETPEAQEAPQ